VTKSASTTEPSKRRPSQWAHVVAPLVGLSFFVLQLPFARFNFDSHHDGYMLAAAIAVRDGALIHRDVITQYGPITSLIHATWLLLPLGPALALRIGTIVMNSLTAMLIADIGRVAPRAWGISQTASVAASLGWILLNDTYRPEGIMTWAVATLPWSSALATFFLTAASWLLAIGSKKGYPALFFVPPGIILGLLPLTRLNVGILSMAMLSISLPLLTRSTTTFRTFTVPFLGSAYATLFATIALLFDRGLLQEYWGQAIDTPRSNAGHMTALWHPATWIVTSSIDNALILLALLVLLATWRSTPRNMIAPRVGVTLGFLLIALWMNRLRWPSLSQLRSVGMGFTWTGPRSWEEFGVTHFLAFGGGVSCVLLTGTIALGGAPNRRPRLEIGALLAVSIFSIANLAQIYPAWDSRHYWWGMPILMIFFFSGIETIAGSGRTVFLFLGCLVFAVGPSLFAGARQSLDMNSHPLDHIPLLEGMRSSEANAEFLTNRYSFVHDRQSVLHPALFLSHDGDLSVLSNRYQSIDAYFIGWDKSAPLLVERSKDRPGIISDYSVEELVKTVGSTDYFIASRAANLTHLLAPPCIGGNCPEIEPDDVCMAWGSCRPRSTPTPLELVPDTSFRPVTPWTAWNVKVNTGFSYPEDDGAWITGHHARLTFTDVAADTVRISLYPFLPPEWTHIDISVLTDSTATPIRLNEGITTIDLPIKPNTWNELVFRCDTFHRPSELGLGEDERPLCAKILGFEPIASGSTP